MSFSKFIEDQKKYWGPEFAEIVGIDHIPELDDIASMGCYTMIYHIADNFRGGEFRDEILAYFEMENVNQ